MIKSNWTVEQSLALCKDMLFDMPISSVKISLRSYVLMSYDGTGLQFKQQPGG